MILFACNLAAMEDQDFLISALPDWLIVGIYTGNRKSGWAQEHKLGKNNHFTIWDQSIRGDGSSKAFTQKGL
eukprot:13614074-Ditylum_brightwellii.AAC.1